jgi:hypothetical protein
VAGSQGQTRHHLQHTLQTDLISTSNKAQLYYSKIQEHPAIIVYI